MEEMTLYDFLLRIRTPQLVRVVVGKPYYKEDFDFYVYADYPDYTSTAMSNRQLNQQMRLYCVHNIGVTFSSPHESNQSTIHILNVCCWPLPEEASQ